jgi:formate hydrogenlyase subunit 6/NADH:ubiquinone oxidoreductase subunit I
MAYVITQACIKSAACVQVCPANCIHPLPHEADFETATHLSINPAECIDCGACAEVCPVNAIFEETELPGVWEGWQSANADYFHEQKTFSLVWKLQMWKWSMWLKKVMQTPKWSRIPLYLPLARKRYAE